MGTRYTVDQLLFLKDSPLVKKPENLPPSEEWMGPVADSTRAQSSRREPSDRHGKPQDPPLLEPTNRRLTSERRGGSANPEDIVLGPPKTAFASSTSIRNSKGSLDISERSSKDSESGRRFGLHKTLGDIDPDRVPARDGRRPRRDDGDQDGEPWTKVKPRKSFGAEGAPDRMFNGRMGGERHKDDRRTRDSHDRDHKDRPTRGFDNYSRDKDADHDHEDTPRKERNGVGRGRSEPSWFKDKEDPPPTGRNGNGNRHADSNRGWREKDRDEGEKGGERSDRRWNRDKDQRQERDPEWMAEAEDEKKNTHTMEDFEKWKKSMKASNGDTPAEDGPSTKNVQPSNGFEAGSFFGPESAKVDTPLGIDIGPDRFFGQWAAAEKKEKSSSDSPQEEGLAKAQTLGKASRFKSFFTTPLPEESNRRVTEPIPTREPAPKSDFQGLFGSKNESTSEDKEAFAALLQKLHSQTIAPPHSTPPTSTNPPPPPVNHENRPQSATAQQIPGSFNQYRPERQEEQRHISRNSEQQLIDLLNPKSPMHSQHPSHPPVSRPEQMVQDIINQRQNAGSQPHGRSEQARDPNSDFMLSLMQGQRAPVQQVMLSRRESQGHNAERQLRHAMDHESQMSHQQQQQQQFEREQRDLREIRDRRTLQAQRQARKQQELSQGFFDEQMMQSNYPQQIEPRNIRPQQPTQILQRPPPGLDNGMPQNWGGPNQQSNQLPPQVQPRHIQPPPGLPGTPGGMLPLSMQQNMQNMNQNMQIPPSGFPPGIFPGMPGAFDVPNSVMQRGGPGPMPPLPPPGFYASAPPPGFLQQQQQQQQQPQGRGMPGHGGYEAMNGATGVAFLQGQMFDTRQPGQGQQGPYRR